MRDRLFLPLAIPIGALIVIAIVLFVMSRILLAVPHVVATPIALFVALAILAACTLIALGAQVNRAALFGGAAVIAILAVTGLPYLYLIGEAMGEAIHEEQLERARHASGLGPGTVELVAQGFTNTFDQTQITFSGEGPYVVLFDNRDTGVLHNWSLYQSRGGPVIYQGANITGPAEIEYTFPPPPPGTYFYQCDIHPTTMIGNATVQ
jgi:plastocyanin